MKESRKSPYRRAGLNARKALGFKSRRRSMRKCFVGRT